MGKLRGRFGPVLALVGLLVILSPLASSAPDGLERVAEDAGFAGRALATVAAPVPDYVWPGIEHAGLATVLAGLAGVVLVLGVSLGLGRLLLRKHVRLDAEHR